MTRDAGYRQATPEELAEENRRSDGATNAAATHILDAIVEWVDPDVTSG